MLYPLVAAVAQEAAPAATSPTETPQVEKPAESAADDPALKRLQEDAQQNETADEEYYELLKTFADTLDQVERNYVKEVSRRELLEAAIQGVLAKLDQYSDYIPPDQIDSFRTGVENEFGGIGIRVGLVDGKLTVITPLISTPAYRAGILTGDQILKIGDVDTQGMSLEDAITKMKGRVGSEIALTVRHRDDTQERSVIVARELVKMETVLGDRRKADDSWDYMFDADHKLGYIRITSFSPHTHDDLQAAVKGLVADGMRGLVLDLRFNPGGLLSTAIEVSDMFLSSGVIVSTSGRNIADRVWSATQDGTYDGFPMVVLVNRYSASASEIVSAALQDHQRAVIMGERTWGKGSVQNIIELEGGRSALKLTTAGYRRPSGKNIHRFEGATDDDDWGV
ncbi:MAG: S41 family peptidase, partial [Planctomycetales bacterium]|nr:S41 family peptidase [Planctomycetales bacterium]